MRSFSIKELESFSGVKAHTIRMWEKRYSIINPQRNIGNIRHYSLGEVQRLLSIAFLAQHGCRISHLAKLNGEKIEQKLSAEDVWDEQHTRRINSLIICMFSCDIEGFEKVLDNCVDAIGLHHTIEDVIIPFLEKVNILSYDDSSCEVHFMVTAVRKKLIMGIEKVVTANNNQKTALMFLPRGEHYDLMLLYITYAMKKRGFKTLYLGTNVSLENVKAISQNKKPDYLCTYLIPGKQFQHEELAGYMRTCLPATKLFVVTTATHHASHHESNVNYFHYKHVPQTVECL